MNNEFNPTKSDLLSIDNMILGIKSKKKDLVAVKIGLQNQLTDLKAKYQDCEYKSEDFFDIKSKRKDLKEHAANVELKIKALNLELDTKNKMRNEIVFHLSHNKSLEGKEDLEKVISKVEKLKRKYSDFTKDRTRIASLRVMASEFVDELEELIKV